MVQVVAGGDHVNATVGRLLLQTARTGRLDVNLHLGRMGSCVQLVGERLLSSES